MSMSSNTVVCLPMETTSTYCIDIHMYVVCRGENASESIQNGYLNLERLGRSSVLAWPRMLTLERL